MEQEFKTSNPAVLACMTAAIFLFTLIVFVAYDMLVARRQRLLMSECINSSQIVSNMYPERVRQRIYAERERELQMARRQSKFQASSSRLLASASPAQLSVSAHDRSVGSQDEYPMDSSAPRVLADMYDMDIVGFSEWHDQRHPVKAVEYLEVVFGAFDAIAKRRGVYKVENIADIYVAATGLPDPQADHAIRMIKFVKDCIKFDRMTPELVEPFGEGTERLGLRVGLNSGPIIAGVLRGAARSHFSVFGDTINTTSRVQKHGEPGCIHISESTATDVARLGKKHWLIPRKEKGKGDIQTFWIVSHHDGFAPSFKTASTQSESATGFDGLDSSSRVEFLKKRKAA